MSVTYNTTASITLAGTDADGDSLLYSVIDQPLHGSLSGTAPNLTYTPDSNYEGADSFTFQVDDGTINSGNATVSITVSGPLAANSAIYFCNQNNMHWTDLANWFADSGCSTPAMRVPADGDSVVITNGNPDNGPSAVVSLAGFTGGMDGSFYTRTPNLRISAGGILICNVGTWTGVTADNTVTSTFSGGCLNEGLINGDATFTGAGDFTSNDLEAGVVAGIATFNGDSFNTGIVQTAVFNDSSANFFYGWSTGTVNAGATFNNRSSNGGWVQGNATFNGNSVNFGDARSPGDSVVNGDATFNGSSSNGDTVNGNAFFFDSSHNDGLVNNDATFNGSSSNDLGTVNGTATFSGSSTSGGVYGSCTGNGC